MNTIETLSTLEILNGTKICREGEYLKVADLGDLYSLVVTGSPRMVRYYLSVPATGLAEGRFIFAYTVKRNRITNRHSEFALEYAKNYKARLQTA